MNNNNFDNDDLSGLPLTPELMIEIADFLGFDRQSTTGISFDVVEEIVKHPDFLSCYRLVQRLHGVSGPSRSVVPLQMIESEYEDKARKILLSDLEFSDVSLIEFLELIFERRQRDFKTDIPFEEIQSPEYCEWVRQKKAIQGTQAVDYSSYRMWRYNPVIFFKEDRKARHRLLLKDDEETLAFLENRQFAIMAPMTYVGNTNTYGNARYLYALTFDIDGIGLKELGWLLRGMEINHFPLANMIVNSGHGVHLYYLLEKPVPMFKRNIELLNKLKARLTKFLWTISADDNPQYQGINQGFRIPGTLTKFGKPIRAFWCSKAPMYTPASLNGYLTSSRLPESDFLALDSMHPYDPSKVTKEEARRRWPEWYAARVIGKKRVGKKWKLNKGLYDWWLGTLREENKVTVHHRYWCILTLVVYAVKCDIPIDVVRRDAYSLLNQFDNLTDSEDNHFTKEDVEDALRAYDEGYNKWPIKTIESTTAIRIQRCRRNGRDQNVHLRRIRMLQEADYPDGTWREGNGRKKGSTVSAEDSRCAAIVREWQEQNPDCRNKSKCARDTGLDRKTVRKWWLEN